MLKVFLPDYNRRFAVAARDTDLAYVKPEDGFRADEYFCVKEPRTVGIDNVVRYEQTRLQVLPRAGRSSYARCKVEVHKRLDGALAVYHQGKLLETRCAPPEAALLRTRKPGSVRQAAREIVTAASPRKPAPDHPWRGTYRIHLD